VILPIAGQACSSRTANSSTCHGEVATKNGALVLRASPDRTAAKVRTLARGAALQILGAQGEWYEVKHAAARGYVARQYVSVQCGEAPKADPAREHLALLAAVTFLILLSAVGGVVLIVATARRRARKTVAPPYFNLGPTSQRSTAARNARTAAVYVALNGAMLVATVILGAAIPLHIALPLVISAAGVVAMFAQHLG
jgi:hypothetical protein